MDATPARSFSTSDRDNSRTVHYAAEIESVMDSGADLKALAEIENPQHPEDYTESIAKRFFIEENSTEPESYTLESRKHLEQFKKESSGKQGAHNDLLEKYERGEKDANLFIMRILGSSRDDFTSKLCTTLTTDWCL